MEVWKKITGFENYEVSDLGNVKSSQPNKKERFLKLRISRFGYARVMLQQNNIKKEVLVHRLVALHFIENTLNKEQVNHIDCNKLNNKVSNLEWCNQSENMIHSLNNGRNKKAREIIRGIDTEFVVYKSIKEASIDNNVSTASIHQCLKGKSKTCKGYKWMYL